jgi:benzodiazapine receptor
VPSLLRLAISVGTPLLVGALSGFATARSVTGWYVSLRKPVFNPPSWIFGPVWTALYVLMGIALYLVWRNGWDRDVVRWAVALFGVQLALNGLWSLLFFGMQSPGWAFVEILLLWAAIATTLVAFWRVELLAGALLIPYFLWVSFAVLLNGSIWMLNR